MIVRKLPAGVKILIAVTLFVITFLLARPSDPATSTQIAFWKWAAGLFNEPDVEGFVGISLWVICSIVTVVGYQVIVRVLERRKPA